MSARRQNTTPCEGPSRRSSREARFAGNQAASDTTNRPTTKPPAKSPRMNRKRDGMAGHRQHRHIDQVRHRDAGDDAGHQRQHRHDHRLREDGPSHLRCVIATIRNRPISRVCSSTLIVSVFVTPTADTISPNTTMRPQAGDHAGHHHIDRFLNVGRRLDEEAAAIGNLLQFMANLRQACCDRP